ncbi:hypothetical protein ACLOJK_028787 [Asimina triloba]
MAHNLHFILLSLVLASFFEFSVSQSQAANITLGSSLSPGNDSVWLSPSEDFAFGFYNVTGGLYLAGIWYNNIPTKTLVWSANRDSPVQRDSLLQLTNDGLLLIRDPQGTSTSFSIFNDTDAGVTSASMEDSGNLVLRNSSGVVWQSFDYPTDTLLPGQVLNPNQQLVSNANGTHNYSTGRYVLRMQQDGNLVLTTNQFDEWGYWWTTESVDLGRERSLVFNQSTAQMYLVLSANRTTINRTKTADNDRPTPVGDYYHRAMIDDGGNFRQYSHLKAGNGTWRQGWKAVPNPCLPTAICGAYGYCSEGNDAATCECIPGFSQLDPNDPSRGCSIKQPLLPSCGGDSSEQSFEVRLMRDTDFPNNEMLDLVQIPNSNEAKCRQAVLDDCFCMAAVLEEGKCRKKRAPLLNGRAGTGRIAFIKVANGTASPAAGGGQEMRKKGEKHDLVVGLVASSVVAALLAAVLCAGIARRFKRAKPSFSNINLQAYTYQELKEATEGFTRRIGRGAFGTVYSGVLRFEDKQVEVAVKQLQKVFDEGEKEFRTEISVIGRTYHKNLVRLLGFCDEKKHRLLVYELMKGGSLSAFLFRTGEKPSWCQRAEIALGIARGLSYLHEECETQIIHCDIKPQNVLLDENNIAKIADFGLAKLLKKDQTRTCTNVRGTMGYMAPEWLKNAPVTAKVDVYSFGIMLLEIICCRRHIELDRIGEESDAVDLFISDWVESCVRAGELGRLVEQDEEVLSDLKRFERMVMVGLWCTDPDPALRPSMKRVKQMLEGTIEVGLPPLLAE